jgi:hypothetical protein
MYKYRSKDGTWRGQHTGKRTGRPKSGPRASERHKTREPLNARTPVYVVIRVADAVGGLRKRRAFVAIREGLITSLARADFRVVHLSIQATHVHLLVEADDANALARGMQGFQISAAKHLNAELRDPETGQRRRGTVFPDRYHATQITNPRAARNTLSYILNKGAANIFSDFARLRALGYRPLPHDSVVTRIFGLRCLPTTISVISNSGGASCCFCDETAPPRSRPPPPRWLPVLPSS